MNYIALLSFFIVFISCSEKGNDKDLVKEEKLSPKTTEICNLISKSTIEKIFNPKNTVSKKEPSSNRFPTCIYKWKAEKKAEKKVGGQLITYDAENVVTIVLGSTNATTKQFEQSTSVYKDSEDIDLADAALWSEKMHQLSVLKNNMLFHINVDYHDDTLLRKKRAVALANSIISQL